ncbi:MAG: hypothetical protein HRT72_07385 [Flavobacteriales bacterium]|nr:hypothetical protein [Flavobacteriales bacterium]
MTLAQRLKTEGFDEGIEKGMHDAALGMLRQDIDLEIISKATNLTVEQINDI